MAYEFKLVSSLEKNLMEKPDCVHEVTGGSMFKNEIHSFQLMGRKEAEGWPYRCDCRVEVESPIADYVKLYEVGLVPVLLPAYPDTKCEDYLSKEPGLYPDPLYTLNGRTWDLFSHQTKSLWVAVEPEGKIAGTYPITLKIYDEEKNMIGEKTYTLEIIDKELPPLPIYNTSWFHGDCIAVHHGVELQSNEYFVLLEEYMQVFKKFGHNLILTPVFTPPLDTAIGGERPTNQLVQVTVENGKYSFDFSLLKRFVDLAKKVGIPYFEISHLYTQWGARYAPKVMATVDGEYRQIFGWETDALGEDYSAFMGAFLPELTAFLKAEGIMERCLFHVSDEPSPEHNAQYNAAKEILTRYINEDQFIDALSAYELYESGAVKHPVVSNNHIHHFMEKGVKDLWTYYCCAQGERVANRFMSMPSYRNRVLGTQLYKFRIKGFLQWGFNFWFAQRSIRSIDPYTDTSCGGGFPSGDAFMVYPKKNGELVKSLRLYVFNEAMQDLRALKLLETLEGREAAEKLLDEIESFENYPRNSAYYLDLRQKINEKIKAHI